MAKVRIFQWAKENGKRSNEIVKKLQTDGIKVRNHTDIVEEAVLLSLYAVKEEIIPASEDPVEPIVEEIVEKEKEDNSEEDKVKVEPKAKTESGFIQPPKPLNATKSEVINKPRGKVPTGGYPPPPARDSNPAGFVGENPNRSNATNGYRGNKNSAGTSTGSVRGRQPFSRGKPEPKQEELDPTTTKPVNAKKIPINKKKKTTYDRFAQFDIKESTVRIDQKTRTQMKKEARNDREQALANETTVIKWTDDMTVGKFSMLLKIPAVDVIGKLFELGILATINQPLVKESAEILCTDYNVEIVEDDSNQEYEFENLIPEYSEEEKTTRPPIVTIMGHVDHGKTTLLDSIRKTNLAAKESGGITQHIGAYQVEHNGRYITFLDTPGHAAFSAMRSRGADVTDITVLVVSADDGVMPQTKESIAHSKEAKTPLIVAINKIDKEGAQPDRVMSELADLGVLAEEWGGDVPFVKISALNSENIDGLLEYIEVVADMHEYKAPVEVPGYGTVIEAHLDKGKGSVATILVKGGSVELGDSIIIGHTWGSIRVMQDEYNVRHKKIGPSTPVQITGLKDVPHAGEKFLVMKDVKEAQMIGEKRSILKNLKDRNSAHAMSLDELNTKIAEGEIKELPIIIKCDVQGSVEALASSLEEIAVNGVKARIVYKGVGPINESDVMLASTSGSIIVGFNVRPDANSRQLIDSENVQLLLSNIIYNIIDEIEGSMTGMREIKYKEIITGYSTIIDVFKITGHGKVAGCTMTEGKITRVGKLRLIRDNIVIYEGDIGQLKRFKDDVSEVSDGMEFGMSIKGFEDLKKGDQFEGYILEEIQE